MEYSVEKLSGNKVKITFTAPAADFEEAVQKAYLKVRGQISVPGFRK
ncbi:MAG: trigger factor family protein, partial [Clostridia bacterium]|nr:trigger factor family protein [Clostridia bacterium]